MTRRLMFIDTKDKLNVVDVPVLIDAADTQMNIQVDSVWGEEGQNNLVEFNTECYISIVNFEGGVAFAGEDYGYVTSDITANPDSYYTAYDSPTGHFIVTLPDPSTHMRLVAFHQLATGSGGSITIVPTHGQSYGLTGKDSIVEYCWMSTNYWEIMFAT